MDVWQSVDDSKDCIDLIVMHGLHRYDMNRIETEPERDHRRQIWLTIKSASSVPWKWK